MTVRLLWGCATVAALTVVAGVAPAAFGKGTPTVDKGRVGIVTPSGATRIVATPGRHETVVVRRDARTRVIQHRATIPGRYGVPYVTFRQTGGLTPDGRLLVLADPYDYPPGQTESEFVILDARRLTVRATIHLKGAFSFDAISPSGATLFLIQHLSARDARRYAVRAYDVRRRQLLAAPVVDKSEPDERMAGYAQLRASDRDGTRVYTLYTHESDPPFIHALNTRRAEAVCIDLPLPGGPSTGEGTQLTLSPDGRRLDLVRGSQTLVQIDTRTDSPTVPGASTG
jgi:hypothetical protein